MRKETLEFVSLERAKAPLLAVLRSISLLCQDWHSTKGHRLQAVGRAGSKLHDVLSDYKDNAALASFHS